MSILEANLRILKAHYPDLALLLEGEEKPFEGEGWSGSRGDIRMETSASGLPVMSVRGIHLHSSRDPVREAERLAASLNEGEGPIVICGLALAYTAEACFRRFPRRPLVIAERHITVLKAALENRDLGELLLNARLLFVQGGSGEGVLNALSLLEKEGRGKALLLKNQALCRLNEAWYSGIEARVRNFSLREDVNTATLRRFGKRWIRNLSRNMNAIRDLPGVSRLEGVLSPAHGAPVFLAAAGPGLDRIAPLLPAIARRCLVVAVDTSLRFCLKNGVEPDFAVAVDPQYWNARHLDRASSPRTMLIAESAVYPPVLAELKEGSFRGGLLCASLFPLGAYIEERVDPKGELGAGGSVSTTAWDFCRLLGASEILIAGLDLSFPGLKTHFRGAAFEELALSRSGRLSPGETWSVKALREAQPFLAPASDGGRVLTDRRLSLYASWFENRFRLFPEIKNYSLGTGGIAIAGLETQEPGAILALPERREEINSLLEDVYGRIDREFFGAAVPQRAEAWEKALQSLLRGLESLTEAASNAAVMAEHALSRLEGGGLSPRERESILSRLDTINRRITGSDVKEVAGFLFPPSAELEKELAAKDASAQMPGDPLRRHLAFSGAMYGALSAAAAYNLRQLSRIRNHGQSGRT
ncbi:MAG: DUF115 domain-containing protein [Treponema sp.]|jgi:hypothetical protein|nr:DUF115 domain-containing protein [Treponema sp.]